jgi:large repetitive protein
VYIVTVTDDNGCIDSDTVTITVKDVGELKIANMITPNGDAYNDTWIIEPPVRPEVFVFNSSGKEIFSSFSYDNLWSGTFNGAVLPDGTYFYIVKSGGKVYKGALTVLTGN